MQVELYQDLMADIKVIECKIDDLSKEYSFWRRNCSTVGSKPAASLDECLRRMEAITDQVREYEELLSGKKQTLARMRGCINESASMAGKIRYMRMVEKKTLREISTELGYSLDLIKSVSCGRRNGRRKGA